MLTIYAVGLGKNEGIRLHVRIPNTFSMSLLSFFMMQFALGKTTFLNSDKLQSLSSLFLYDAICVGEDDFLELGQASKSVFSLSL